jgi:hypothetical protein
MTTERETPINMDNNSADKSLTNLILSSLPKENDWAKFSGSGEYNHYKFMDCIDNIKEDTNAPDQLICSRLTTIFTVLANMWYTSRKRKVGPGKTWEFWKEEIIKKFSTPEWKRKVKIAFRRDKFDVTGNKESCDWVTTQVNRLRAIERDISIEEINDKLLSLLDHKTE